MLEKTKLTSSIKKANKANKKSAKKVGRRVETRSITGLVISNCLKAFVLLFFGAIVLFPFYYMISASLMTNDEVLHIGAENIGNDIPTLIPDVPQWGNYAEAAAQGYWVSFIFSTIVMIVQILLKITVCILMGYAFGRYEFRGKKTLWALFLLTLMIPEVSIMSGQFWVSKHIIGTNNIIGTTLCLVGPFTASIFTAYLFRNGFEAIDDSVKEAALIDGISSWKFFFTLALPMIAPVIWTQIILTALASWNSYMWPSIILGMGKVDVFGVMVDIKTIPLWLFDVGTLDEFGNAWSYTEIKMAGSFLAIIPTLVMYLIFRKRINMTVAGSANKG